MRGGGGMMCCRLTPLQGGLFPRWSHIYNEEKQRGSSREAAKGNWGGVILPAPRKVAFFSQVGCLQQGREGPLWPRHVPLRIEWVRTALAAQPLHPFAPLRSLSRVPGASSAPLALPTFRPRRLQYGDGGCSSSDKTVETKKSIGTDLLPFFLIVCLHRLKPPHCPCS